MPSDKCNSITAKAMGLISSLFNVAGADPGFSKGGAKLTLSGGR